MGIKSTLICFINAEKSPNALQKEKLCNFTTQLGFDLLSNHSYCSSMCFFALIPIGVKPTLFLLMRKTVQMHFK